MLKKITALSACALFCTAALAGCGSGSHSIPSSAPEESGADPIPSSALEEGSADPLSVENQLSLLVSQKSLWGHLDEDYSDSLSYAVTDLDHNGRLEVISASVSGTGLYTTAKFYEVNSTGDALDACTYDITEYESGADLSFSDTLPCYYDADGDTYYYIFTDIIRNGAAEHFNSLTAISLKNGAVTSQTLGAQQTTYSDEQSEPTIIYRQSDGSEISEEEFNTLADNAFSGAEKKQAAIGWFSADRDDDNMPCSAETMDDDDLLAQLQSSWNGFSVQ